MYPETLNNLTFPHLCCDQYNTQWREILNSREFRPKLREIVESHLVNIKEASPQVKEHWQLILSNHTF